MIKSFPPMERRRLGKTDLVVGVLGLGGWEIGSPNVTDSAVARLLASALDAGLNVIDTAECYEDSEARIGRVISSRRQDVYLFTKCGHDRPGEPGDWRPRSLLASIERSLRRLATDYVDLIQLHTCSLADLERGDAVQALEQARERGWARYIGYSGDGASARYALESGRFDTLQTSVNIADQEAIDLLLPLARQADVGVIAKRPLANAAWQYVTRPFYQEYVARLWRYARGAAAPYYQTYVSRLRALDYTFLRDDADAAAATALRFTLSVPGVHTAIVGTARPGRWEHNAALLQAGRLSAEEFERFRRRWRELADASWVGQN